MTPNDQKLSDCGGRRSLCGKVAGGERSEAVGAQAVTPGAVRCSAWLGVANSQSKCNTMAKDEGGGKKSRFGGEL